VVLAQAVKLSLVIPVYNEVATLREILQRVVAVDFDKELVLVDDGSTDGSRELLAELRDQGLGRWLPNPGAQRGSNEVRLLLQPQNMGKGAACGPGSRRRPATSSSSRTPIWSTTRATSPGSSSRSSTATPTWFSARASSAPRTGCSTSGTWSPTAG
jgi:hypothetical protein